MTGSAKGCSRAVSTFYTPCTNDLRNYGIGPHRVCHNRISITVTINKKRSYAKQQSKAVFQKSQVEHDLINPPSSSLAPPLELPAKGDNNRIVHLFRTGRAYGSFYWQGVKLTWANHKAATPIKQRLTAGSSRQSPVARIPDMVATAMLEGRSVTRGELQMLVRERHDWKKIPVFGLLVAVFGEWLPLIVPFVPGVVPRTCRFPKQVEGMRKKAEERRRASFRSGLEMPDMNRNYLEQKEGAATDGKQLRLADLTVDQRVCTIALAQAIVEKLTKPELVHVSTSLGLHRPLWDRLGLQPPSFLLKYNVATHLQYLGVDDTLLLRQPGQVETRLEDEEVRIACEERGLNVVGRPTERLRADLKEWLKGRAADNGRGNTLVRMLFARPNAY